jgi:hypothetical protein
MFRKLEPFPPWDEGKQTPILVGSLEIANLNRWTEMDWTGLGPNRAGVSLPSLRMETSIFRNVVLSSYL